jgi:hypothetical protein
MLECFYSLTIYEICFCPGFPGICNFLLLKVEEEVVIWLHLLLLLSSFMDNIKALFLHWFNVIVNVSFTV